MSLKVRFRILILRFFLFWLLKLYYEYFLFFEFLGEKRSNLKLISFIGVFRGSFFCFGDNVLMIKLYYELFRFLLKLYKKSNNLIFFLLL